MEAFSTFDEYKNRWDFDGLKCELKSVYAVYFTKQMSSTQEVVKMIVELKLNQTLAEVSKLLQPFLTIPVPSVFLGEISSSLIECVNNYKRCSETEN